MPAFLLQGSDDGVDPRRTIDGSRFPQLVGIALVPGGHNLIQENPQAVVDAIRALA